MQVTHIYYLHMSQQTQNSKPTHKETKLYLCVIPKKKKIKCYIYSSLMLELIEFRNIVIFKESRFDVLMIQKNI